MLDNTEGNLLKANNWFEKKANTLYARIWLAAFSFTESCIFFIPPDPLLAAMVFVHKNRWIKYALITSVSSVAGAVFGYILGAVLFDTFGLRIIEFYSLQSQLENAALLINKNVFIFTLTAAFTPVPFKVAVLAAGFTKANFISFITAAIGGRAARYFFIAYVARVFGNNAERIMKRFWFFATGAGILIFGVYVIFYFLMQ